MAGAVAARAEMPRACLDLEAFAASDFQNKSTLVTTRAWNSQSPMRCTFSEESMSFQGVP